MDRYDLDDVGMVKNAEGSWVWYEDAFNLVDALVCEIRVKGIPLSDELKKELKDFGYE